LVVLAESVLGADGRGCGWAWACRAASLGAATGGADAGGALGVAGCAYDVAPITITRPTRPANRAIEKILQNARMRGFSAESKTQDHRHLILGHKPPLRNSEL